MTPRARKALLSLMIPLAFAPVVAGADDDVPALLQFAERYQRQDAPAAETVVTPSQESQSRRPGRFKLVKRAHSESNWRSCKRRCARKRLAWSNSKPLFNPCSRS